MSIGSRLKEWRQNNNLTTTDIHRKTGVSTGGLSDYENDVKLIGSKTLITLSQHYEIDIQYILTGVRTKGDLNENQKELLKLFDMLPEREQIKEIGKMEDKVQQINVQLGKLSDSKIG